MLGSPFKVPEFPADVLSAPRNIKSRKSLRRLRH
jgi:hypothetical protein